MYKIAKSLTSILSLAAVASVGYAVVDSDAYAIPQVSISDGFTTVTIADGGANDLNAASGVIDFNETVGPFIINSGSAVTKPAVGGSSAPFQQLNSLDVSLVSGVLTLMFTETDFSGGPTDLSMAFGGVATLAGTVDYEVYASSANTAFALDTLIGGSTGLTGAHSDVDSGSVLFAGPYSLTTVVTITHTGVAPVENTSINALVTTAIPAAGFAPVLVVGGLFAAARMRRRAA